jgi:hypothetical protein
MYYIVRSTCVYEDFALSLYIPICKYFEDKRKL